jgi:hypothetical protein
LQQHLAVNLLVVVLEAVKVSIYKKKRLIIYFMCLGNKKLPIEKRIYLFYTLEDLSKHFKLRYLARIKEGKEVECNLCYIKLDNKMHLQ